MTDFCEQIMKILRSNFCLFIIFFCCFGNAFGDDFPMWGKLRKGKYSVGFKTTWELDYSRAYNATFSDKTVYSLTKAPRPILINVWYPAVNSSGALMPQGEYLNFVTNIPQLAKFSSALAEYERDAIAQEVVGKQEPEFDADEKRLFEELLSTSTAALKNAKEQVGKFPLVVYHGGYGSSIEDNSVLCEFLASHGYVVINSAFQRGSGTSFNIDAGENSRADIKYLIDYARKLPNVDWRKIALMGHSGGAHTINTFQALGNSAADVLVSLDTTQDYHPLTNHDWDYMTNVVLAKENIPNMRVPTLVVADRTAIFEMFDRLKDSDRYYLTFQNMEHNDFISQGIFNRRLAEKLSVIKSKKTKENDEIQNGLRLAQAGNEELDLSVLNFFNAFLKNDSESKMNFLDRYKNNDFNSQDPHLEYFSKDQTEPPRYDLNSNVAPSPGQMRFIIAQYGIDKTASIIRRFSAQTKESPIYQIGFVYILLDEMLDKKKEDGLALLKVYEESDASFRRRIPNRFIGHGERYFKSGENERALNAFRKALLVDPENKDAAAKLK